MKPGPYWCQNCGQQMTETETGLICRGCDIEWDDVPDDAEPKPRPSFIPTPTPWRHGRAIP